MSLTRRQKDLQLFLQRTIDATGVAPTFAEMCAAVGLKSTSGITRILAGLERRGYIKRTPKLPRAIDILKRVPEPPPAHPVDTLTKYLREEVGIRITGRTAKHLAELRRICDEKMP